MLLEIMLTSFLLPVAVVSLWVPMAVVGVPTLNILAWVLGVLTSIVGLICSVYWIIWRVQLARVRTSEEESADDNTLELVGDPRFDPSRGIVAQAVGKSGSYTVLIQPKWWDYLSKPEKSTEEKEKVNEAAVLHRSYSKVVEGNEPKSLVCIRNLEGKVCGLGTRVKWNGETYLLTAYHVWFGMNGVSGIAKNGKVVEVDSSWKVVFSCKDSLVDFVMLSLPLPVWSKLGVSAANLQTCQRSTCVTAYGGASSRCLLSGLGVSMMSDTVPKLIHNCPTAFGWSGCGLYDKNENIVGIHLGVEDRGVENRGTDVARMLLAYRRNDETEYSDVSFKEINEEEVESRSYDFREIEVTGLGKMKLGKSEYVLLEREVVRKARLDEEMWADDEEEDTLPPVSYFAAKYRSGGPNETLDHLNCLGAESVRVSPPCEDMLATSGRNPSESQDTVECLSLKLADRLLSLEKLVANLTQEVCAMRLENSRNLVGTPGPNEVLEQSSTPSCSKPDVLEKPQYPTTGKKPVETSKESIRGPQSAPASRENGVGKKSRRKRRKSSSQMTSIQKPVPAFPAQS